MNIKGRIHLQEDIMTIINKDNIPLIQNMGEPDPEIDTMMPHTMIIKDRMDNKTNIVHKITNIRIN